MGTVVHLKSEVYICDSCGDKFTSKKNLDVHNLYKHTNPAQQTKFECKLCGKYFLVKGERLVHLRKVHGKVIKEKCNYCGIEEFPKKAMYHTCNNMQKFFKESIEDCNKYERSFEELYVDESEKSKN